MWQLSDPVPAGEEVCVPDEELAWTIAGQRGRRIGKVWTRQNYEGNSKVIVAPDAADLNNDGCSDGQSFDKDSFGPNFNNNVESADTYSGCGFLQVFDYKNQKGYVWYFMPPSSSLFEANNRNGSMRFSP